MQLNNNTNTVAETADTEPNQEYLLKWAQYYGKSGWNIFPVAYGSKVPLKGSNGLKDATCDPEKIQGWWANKNNIGMNCGASKIVCVDCDIPDGEANFKALPGYEPFETLTATTRSGGKHFLFLAGDSRIKNSTGTLAPQVDVKAEGGYILVEPSHVFKDDKAGAGGYQFDAYIMPIEIPGWLERLLKTEPVKPKAKLNKTTSSLMGNDFPCNEDNKDKLRQAVRNRIQRENCSSEGAWFELMCCFRSLIYECDWTDEQAWGLFDEICQWAGMGNYDYDSNRKRWDVDDYKAVDGKTYKSLLDDYYKNIALRKHHFCVVMPAFYVLMRLLFSCV